MAEMISQLHYQHLADVPSHLATRSELRSWGLRPGGPPVASVTVVARVSGAARQEKLYPVAEAVAAGGAADAAEAPARTAAASEQERREQPQTLRR